MAINPATGYEDPYYAEPVDEGYGDDYNKPILTDQDDVMSSGTEEIAALAGGLQEGVDNVTAGNVNYDPVDSSALKQDAGVDKGSSYISPEATVSGQLDTLLNKDSAYMGTISKRAEEQAASLGLAGSSMAVGAAQRAAIESALPIAQQDAKTYADTALAEQATYNEISRMKSESDLTARARSHIYDIAVEEGKLNAKMESLIEGFKLQGNVAAEGTLAKMKAQWETDLQAGMSLLDAQLTKSVNEQELSAQEREWATTTASSIMAASYGTISDLMGNEEFMLGFSGDTGAEDLAKVFNNYISLAKDQVAFIGSSAGLTQEWNDPDTGYLTYIGEWNPS